MIKNNRGFLFGLLKINSLVLKIIIIVSLAILFVPSLMSVFPIVKYVMMAIIAFFIFQIVQKSFGNNILTYLVTGVLLYFIVYKYLFLSTSLLMLYFFLGAGVLSVFIWGTSRFSK